MKHWWHILLFFGLNSNLEAQTLPNNLNLPCSQHPQILNHQKIASRDEGADYFIHGQCFVGLEN